MKANDAFSEYYAPLLDGTYDCVDRIVLNGYFILAQSPGGFRTWWRHLYGTDENLDDTHLMRFAGRFARRVRAFAERQGIPLIECGKNDRDGDEAKEYSPADPKFRGVYCIACGRAPAAVWDATRTRGGGVDLRWKTPRPYVNHYLFYIMDPEWGRVIVRLCPHPPFNAMIILNGHEYVAIEARNKGLAFSKEENCFTEVSSAAGLDRVADTMTATSCVGRMEQVCERWIYSACLCFGLDLAEQRESGFRYSYSVYQAEYSRNLLFCRGKTMEQVFQSVIDRSRAPLTLKTVKTIFGRQLRRCSRNRKGKPPRFEVVVERPVYDLVVFKVHFGKLTVKMYSKGDRVLRIEVIVHNAKQEFRDGHGIGKFPSIIGRLQAILERFLNALNGIDIAFIDDRQMEKWPLPATIGATRVGGLNVNQPRIRAVMQAVVALSVAPSGFTSADVAAKVREIPRITLKRYRPSQAAYDLKKLRAKKLVRRIGKSRRYETTPAGLRAISAFTTLYDKVLLPLLANGGRRKRTPIKYRSEADIHYHRIQAELQLILQELRLRKAS